jgi:single-stranded-DNA-specific exonuclease
MIDNRKEITTGRYKWVFRSWGEDVKLPEFFREFPLSHEVARILYRRGLTTRAQVSHFLYDTMNDLADPFLMKGMKAAAERIVEARQRREPVVIYGDYDVDGITSTSILYRFFKRRGFDVGYYIPDRETEGYGLNEPALQHLAEKGYRLLITVDCGIASADVIKKAPSSLDIIVTDHHLPPEVLPEAVAVIDPHQEDCQYPFKELAGCGVAFTVCRAVSLLVDGKDYREDVELAALGTIADVVSLTGENRILVKEGLRRFRRTSIVGIRALLDAAGVVKRVTEVPLPWSRFPSGWHPGLMRPGALLTPPRG